jgi:hypothetical protein
MKLCLLLLLASVASAGIIPIAQPTPTYTSETTLLDFSALDYDIVSQISDGTLTVSFLSGGSPTLMDVDVVPDNWATWGSPPATENSTPSVLDSDSGYSDVVLSFSSPLEIFGVELEPDDMSTHTITATFYDGETPVGSVQQSVSGDAGALLFAASGGPFDSVDISSDIDVGMADVRYELAPIAAPEPSTLLLVGAGLALLVGRPFLGRGALRYRPF